MAEEFDFTNRSEQDVLLSFTANKGHRTRQVNKINNLLTLQDQKYSKATEETLLKIVAALETVPRSSQHLRIMAPPPRVGVCSGPCHRGGNPGNSHRKPCTQRHGADPQPRPAGRSWSSRRSRPASRPTSTSIITRSARYSSAQ